MPAESSTSSAAPTEKSPAAESRSSAPSAPAAASGSITVSTAAASGPAATTSGAAGTAGSAAASTPRQAQESRPRYSYREAIREHLFVTTTYDNDRDGKKDIVSFDVVRPKASGAVPVIMQESPYFTSVGRGPAAQKKVTDANGVVVGMPLFYDNYFVPRGYAFVAVDQPGTGRSTGCSDLWGPVIRDSAVQVLDYLAGRRTATNDAGQQVRATWSNGSVGMIGKSADGADAVAAAATGHPALKTVVAISAPVDMYQSVIESGYEPAIFDGVGTFDASAQPGRQCAASDGKLAKQAAADPRSFYRERSVLTAMNNYRAATFLVSGQRDGAVSSIPHGELWKALVKKQIPARWWISQLGHADPFDVRRRVWVETLHAWFDHYLLGIGNGVDSQPPVSAQQPDLTWQDKAGMPVPGSELTEYTWRTGVLRAEASSSAPSAIGRAMPPSPDTDYRDTNPGKSNQIEQPDAVLPNRVIVLTKPLPKPLSLQGFPEMAVSIQVESDPTPVRVALVDYGPGRHVFGADEGYGGELVPGAAKDCWGESTPKDTACFRTVSILQRNTDFTVLGRCFGEAGHRGDPFTASPVPFRQWLELSLRCSPLSQVIPAGHRLGLVFMSGDLETGSPPTGALTIGSDGVLRLPVVG